VGGIFGADVGRDTDTEVHPFSSFLMSILRGLFGVSLVEPLFCISCIFEV